MIRDPILRALPDESPERSAPIREFLVAVRRRWWAVAIVFALVVGITMWRTSLQQRMYRATATVRIEEAPAMMAGIQSPAARVDYRIDPMQTEQRVITSQEIAERVTDALGLRLQIAEPADLQRTTLFGRSPVIVRHPPESYADYQLRLGDTRYVLYENGREVGSAVYGDSIETPMLRLTVPDRSAVGTREVLLRVIPRWSAGSHVRQAITTRPIPQTNVMEISFTSNDPALSKRAADVVAATYETYSSENRREESAARTAFIAQALDSQQVRLSSAQEALKLFKENARISNVQAEQSALASSIRSFETERDAALVERGLYQSLLGGLAAADTSTEDLRKLAATQAVERNPNMSTLYDRWFELTKEREQLMSTGRYNDEHRDVRAVDNLIARTKQELRDASGYYLQGLHSRIASLNDKIAGLRQELALYPPLEQREQTLLANLSVIQNVYQQLASELQTARITENGEGGYVSVIDVAQQPTAPVAPARKRIFITAVICGLLLGLGAAVLLENLDDSVRSPEEIRVGMGLPVLGTIPRIRDAASRRGAVSTNARLVTHLDPRSPVAEAYRSLRTNLAFASPSANLRTVVFTSPGPADGKSTTVANLAITLAQQGQRTLIIDADLRRAVLDKVMGTSRSPGLTDLLIGRASLDEAIRSSEFENLYVLPSGAFPPNPSELLGSAAMKTLLQEVGERFDIVLLDSPPLLAVTDAAVLSTVADGTVVVVRTGKTSRAAVRRALGQLTTVQGRLIGAVMNDVDVRDSGYGGGYSYYYYYYHTPEESNGHHVGVGGRLLRWARGDARKG